MPSPNATLIRNEDFVKAVTSAGLIREKFQTESENTLGRMEDYKNLAESLCNILEQDQARSGVEGMS